MLGTVADWMNPRFPTLQASVTIAAARAFLVEHAAPDALVIDPSGRLTGVITDYEILKAELIGEAADAPLERLISRGVWTLSPTDDLHAAAARFRDGRHSLAAVIDGDRLVGGLRRQDVLRAVDRYRQQPAQRECVERRFDMPATRIAMPAEHHADFAEARG